MDLLEDKSLNLVPQRETTGATGPATRNKIVPDSDDNTIDHSLDASRCTNEDLRLRIARFMWSEMKIVFPSWTLTQAAGTLLACLMKNWKSLINASVFESDCEEDASLKGWTSLCMDALSLSDVDTLRTFWACDEEPSTEAYSGEWTSDWSSTFKNAVWRICADKWKEQELSYEGAIVLMGVPFIDQHPNTVSTSDDYALWEELLDYTVSKALDHGVDSVTVLDYLASFVGAHQTGAPLATSVRFADQILSHFNGDEMRTFPQNLFELVADIMRIHYPAVLQSNKPPMRWLARSLTTVIERCPIEFLWRVLEVFQDSVCLWLADEKAAWTEEELAYDVRLYLLLSWKVY